MTLTEHIQANGGTGKLSCPVIAKLAKRAMCSPATLYMVALGHKQPGHKLVHAIETATNGKVTRYVLRPDVFGEAPAAVEPMRKVG